MTAIDAPRGFMGFLLTSPDHGVSQEAKALRKQVEEASERVLETEALGDPRRKALSVLDDVHAECSTDNWDGYEARCVTSATKDQAGVFIRLLPASIPPPEISAEPDGEIAIEWHRGRSRALSVSVGENDELTYAGLFGRSRAHGTEVLDDELPETIAALLRRLLSR